MEPKISFQIATETLKSRYNQLKGVIDELEELGVLVNENLRKYRKDIQDILHFCRADYKFSFLIQGEMNAGKSTCLNALIGQRILAVSSVPETNFITCVVHDRDHEIPMLYTTTLSKIYNSQTSSFYISDDSLEFTGVSGTEDIYHHLNGKNVNTRKDIQKLEDELKKKGGDQANFEKAKEELYKDVKLDDTVYVIKCRIASLEEKIKDEFILKRIQLIDFPGMFEYGQNKITEIYKIFEDNTQGLINILHPLGYQKNVMTKLQNIEKYPNRLLIMINKMDDIEIDIQEEEIEGKTMEKKAEELVKNLQSSLLQMSKSQSSNDLQKANYLQMSKETPNIVHFVAGREEMIYTYLTKYHNSTEQHEKDVYDSVLKALVDDDQKYNVDLRRSIKENQPFAKMDCFEFFEETKNNLFDKIKDSLSDKFRRRFNELVSIEYPKKVNHIREQLIEFIEKMIQENSNQKKTDNTHVYFKCDGCGADPIVGVRYRCKICENFDYCEKCKVAKDHPEHEFEAIEKFSFKEFTKQFCYTGLFRVLNIFLEFREKFLTQFKELCLNLTDAFRLNKGSEFLKELLGSHCNRFNELREETDKTFREEELRLPLSLISIFGEWKKNHSAVIKIIFIETLSLVTGVIQATEQTLTLLYASGSNLLQNVLTCVLDKQNYSGMLAGLLKGIDLSALLLTSVFDSEKKVKNVGELLVQTIVWSDAFNKIFAKIAVECLNLSTTIIEKIERAMNIGEILETVFQDEEKAKELKDKLSLVLEKVKKIPEYN